MAIYDEERKKKYEDLKDDEEDQLRSTRVEVNLNDVASSSRSINMEDREDEEEVKKRNRMVLDIHKPRVIGRSLGKQKNQNVPDGSLISKICCVVPNEPLVQPEATVRKTPEMVVNLMGIANGREPKLIIERKNGLTQADVDSKQARLSIPKRQIIDKDFLNDEELNIVAGTQELSVMLVDPIGREWTLKLKEWNMGTCHVYALINGWNKVVAKNMFEKGYKMQLWSFHSPDMLYFVIVPTQSPPLPPPDLTQADQAPLDPAQDLRRET